MAERFSVSRLAKTSGVTVRTLHHYDEIGLLTPATRTDKGYRYYGTEELYRLQQILFYRELGFSLSEIQDLLDDPYFDKLKALQQHKQQLLIEKKRYEQLIRTVDKTIDNLKNKQEMENYEELYAGFSKEKIAEYEAEVTEKYGADKLAASKAKVAKMSKAEIAAVKEETEAVNKGLAAVMNLTADAPEVQALVKRHHTLLSQFDDISPARYRYLGDMYVSDERFKANYEKYATGLAVFLRDAIVYYCDHL